MKLNILIPLDFSELSPLQLKIGEVICRHNDVKVTLVHVVPGEVDLLPGDKESAVDLSSPLEALNLAATDFAFLLDDNPAEIETLSLTGDPATEILRASEEGDYDLIILGTHRHGHAYDFLVGSTSRSLVGKIRVPVILVPKETIGTHACMRNIVAGVDLGPETVEFAAASAALAGILDANIEVFNVFEPIEASMAEEYRPHPDTRKKDCQEKLETLKGVAPLPDARFILKAVEGYVIPELLKEANTLRGGMVVVGSDNKRTLEDMLIGSISDRLCEGAICPIAIIPLGEGRNKSRIVG